MTPLQFYARIVRTIGIPRRFQFVDGEWVATGPFAKPSAATLKNLEAHGV